MIFLPYEASIKVGSIHRKAAKTISICEMSDLVKIS